MANDGSSSMSNMTAITPGAGTSPRHVGLPVRDTTSGTVITAEIPAVRAGPSYGVLLPDGSVWYPGSRKRLPAPLILRVVVWVLAFAVLFAGAGDFIIRYHPSWVAPLRHIVTTQPTAASGGTTTPTVATGNGKGKGHTTSAAVTPATPPTNLGVSPLTAYSVSGASYTVMVSAGAVPAWVAGIPYVNGHSANTLNQRTLGPGQSLAMPATGDMLVHIGANGTTIKVYRGFALLATVPTPKCPCYLYFAPRGN
ncbi:MAG: hypothetical protein ABSE47_15265 [Acidimicrobiales bacterium]